MTLAFFASSGRDATRGAVYEVCGKSSNVVLSVAQGADVPVTSAREMEAARSLPLILAREFAANVATPFLVLDRDGTLVYFNERAERLIGSTPGELCPLPELEWRQRFSIERLDGSAVADEQTPSVTARRERRPVHETLVYTGLDRQRRVLEVTATPLLGRGGDLEGVFLLFWEVA